MADFFPGFERRRVKTSGAEINLITGGSGYDMLAVWREHAADVADVRGHAIDSGHFIPEERPDETCRALRDFFAASDAARNAASSRG